MIANRKGFENAADFSVPVDLIKALPDITDLVELKLLLYFFSQKTRPLSADSAISWTVMVRDYNWSRNFNANDLQGGLESAVKHGFLSEGTTDNDKSYWLNISNGSQTAEMETEGAANEIGGLFTLYEANIGPITPIIADAVIHANAEYPPAWIREAIDIAVKMNKRSWKYIEAILKRWKEEGYAKSSNRHDSEKNDTAGKRQSDFERFLSGD